MTAVPSPDMQHTTVRSAYLDHGGTSVFSLLHQPTAAANDGTAVLICPPWGWDEEASYRARRTWAEHLAMRGHTTLRIDFPGTGDSGGGPSDFGIVDSWRKAVIVATETLAGLPGTQRIAVLGLGIGGLVAAAAAADGARFEDLLLWGAPPDGRTFVREQRAFARFQSSRYGPAGSGDGGLPDGWLEAGGFVLSPATIEAIEGLDLRSMELGSLERVLLAGRDGIPVDEAVRAAFERAGIEPEIAPGRGWASMCFHPERHDPPLGMFDRVDEWLSTTPSRGSGAPSRRLAPPIPLPSIAAEAIFVVDGTPIRETTVGPDEGFGGSFGVLASPEDGGHLGVCAVFMNAGAIRRVGPNRMWVETARRWASHGVPTFRADMDGIGDADGDADVYRDVARFYAPDRRGHVTTILDALEARGLGPRFVMIGLCAGGFWGFDVGADDERVVEVIAINPKVLAWDGELELRRDARLVERMFKVDPWRRLMKGETDRARVLAIGRAVVTQASRALRTSPARLRERHAADPVSARIADALDRLCAKETRVVLAFSGDEEVPGELERGGILSRLAEWPNLELEELPLNDHTVRPVAAQQAVRSVLDRELRVLTDG